MLAYFFNEAGLGSAPIVAAAAKAGAGAEQGLVSTLELLSIRSLFAQ